MKSKNIIKPLVKKMSSLRFSFAMFTFFVALNCLLSNYTMAQNNVGIGVLVPAPTSLLDLTANDKGLLVPRLTLVQRDAIVLPATGLLIYNTDCNVFNYFNGIVWLL